MSGSGDQVADMGHTAIGAERALGALIIGFAFLSCCFHVQNFDVWWHLKTGALIVQDQAVPRRDPYSFATGASRWVNSGWLTQVGMHRVFDCCGFPGLIVAKALAIAAGVLVLIVICRARGTNPAAWAAVIVCAVMAARFRFRVRPAALSGPLCALFLWLLDRHERRGSRTIWLLPLLMALWVNLHPGFPVGFIVMAPFCLAALWRGRHFSAFLKPTPVRTLTLVGILTVAATLVNPFGHHPLLYPLRLTSAKVFMQDIGEWTAPEFSRFYSPFWCYLAAGLTCVALTWRRLRLSDALLLTVFGSMAVGASRHVFYFAIVTVPVFAKHLTALCQEWVARVPRLGHTRMRKAAALVPAVAAVVLAMGFIRDEWNFPFGFRLRKEFVPEKAINFLDDHELPNNVCNAYQWGGYLAWRCFPNRRVYIDGRCLVYGEQLYLEWKRAVNGEEGWQDILRRRAVNTLLLTHHAPLAILRSDEWRAVYWDDLSAVFVRIGAVSPSFVERFACDLSLPQNFHTNWSDEALRPGLIAALERKIADDPECVTASVRLARCRGLSGEVEAAVSLMRTAREALPRDTTVLNQLAYWQVKAGRTQDAVATYRDLLRVCPGHAVGHHGLGSCYHTLGDLGRAEKHLRKAVRITPSFGAARARLVAVLRDRGKASEAEREATQLRKLAEQP